MKLIQLYKNKKKAVSPILATIILIVLAVAAASVVFVVVNTYLNNLQQNTTIVDAELTRSTAFDFNGNNKGDLLKVGVRNTGNDVLNLQGITVILSFNQQPYLSWQVNSNYTTSKIEPNDIGYIILETSNTSEEVIQGYSYEFSFALTTGDVFSDSITIASVENGGSIIIGVYSDTSTGAVVANLIDENASPEQVDRIQQQLEQSQTPLTGLTVRLYEYNSIVPLRTGTTDANGRITFNARPGYYWARVYYSDTNSTDLTLIVHPKHALAFGEDTYVTKSVPFLYSKVVVEFLVGQNPVSNVPIYAYKQVQIGSRTIEQLVQSTPVYTNSSGKALFLLASNEYYRFESYYQGASYKTVAKLITKNDVITINIAVGGIKIHLLDSAGKDLAYTYMYLLGITGKYTTTIGWGRTNSTGWITFNGVTTLQFKVQLYFGRTLILGPYITVANGIYEIQLPGETLYVHTQTSTNEDISSVIVYLYDQYGRYSGYTRTNDTGYGSFSGLEPGNYTLRTYYSGSSIYSDTFFFNESMVYNFTINAVLIYVNVKDTNGNAISNVYTGLYRASDFRWYGYGYTNINGTSTIAISSSLINSSEFIVRVYYSGSYYSSPNFIIQSGYQVNITVGGVLVNVRVVDQNNNPIKYLYVYAYENGTVYTGRMAYISYYGTGTIKLPENKTYVLSANYADKLINSTSFTVTSGMTVTITINMVSFSVKVLNANGSPSRNTYIALYAKNTPYNTYVTSGRTDQQGLINFNGVDGGHYFVYAYISSLNRYIFSPVFIVNASSTYTLQPDQMTITLQFKDGTPIQNSYFYIYNYDTNYYAGYGTTDSNGQATISIIAGQKYYLRLYGYGNVRTDPFLAVAGGSITITLNLVRVYATTHSSSGTLYNPTYPYYMYAYYANGTYAGYARSNSSGIITFYMLENQTYYLTLYLFGRTIISSKFNASEGYSVDFIVDGYHISAQLIVSGSPVSYGYAYLYTIDNQYNGYSYMNSSNYFNFDFILGNGTYYLRIYYRTVSGTYTWYRSDPFTMNNTDATLVFNVPTVSITVQIFDDSGNTVSNTYAYAYTLDNYYAGYAQTNGNGKATFTLTENEYYTIRAYIPSLSTYVYSNLFLANSTTPTITIHPKPMTVFVHVSTGDGVPNNYVYPLLNGTTTAGYFRTNSSGYATIWVVDNANYYVRVYNSGQYYYNLTLFNTTYTGIIDVNIGGGTVTVLLLDSNNNPAGSGLYVYAFRDNGYYAGYARTNSSGYAIFYLGSGSYYFRSYTYGWTSSTITLNDGDNLSLTLGSSSQPLFLATTTITNLSDKKR